MFAIPCFLQVLFWKLFFAAQQDFAVCPLELRSSNLQGSILRWWVNAPVSRHGWRDTSRSGDRLDMIARAPRNGEVGPVGTLYTGYKL